MQRVLRWTSLVLFGLVALFLIWFGVTYASVTDMLWFHAAAVPEAARDDVRTLYLALMNLIGGASAALGLLSAFVIAVPMRRGASGAATALMIVNNIVFVMAAVTAEELAAATGSPTSWHIMGVLMAVTLSAYALHVAAGRMHRPRQMNTAGMPVVGSVSSN
jgi:hypothetical protein